MTRQKDAQTDVESCTDPVTLMDLLHIAPLEAFVSSVANNCSQVVQNHSFWSMKLFKHNEKRMSYISTSQSNNGKTINADTSIIYRFQELNACASSNLHDVKTHTYTRARRRKQLTTLLPLDDNENGNSQRIFPIMCILVHVAHFNDTLNAWERGCLGSFVAWVSYKLLVELIPVHLYVSFRQLVFFSFSLLFPIAKWTLQCVQYIIKNLFSSVRDMFFLATDKTQYTYTRIHARNMQLKYLFSIIVIIICFHCRVCVVLFFLFCMIVW